MSTQIKRQPINIPSDFRKALNGDSKAKENFEKLPPSHKREYIEAIVEAKKPGTRQRRIAQAVVMIKQWHK